MYRQQTEADEFIKDRELRVKYIHVRGFLTEKDPVERKTDVLWDPSGLPRVHAAAPLVDPAFLSWCVP